MNKLYVLLTLIICGAAIIFGNLHWNDKISAQGEKASPAQKSVVDKEKNEPVHTQIDVAVLSKNLPENVQKKIKQASETKKPLQFVIYGSDSTPTEKGAWPEQLKNKLIESYGEGIFNLTVISEGAKTTREVIDGEGYKEVSKLKPDIVLFEPFMLKDNNAVVGIPNTLANIEDMLEDWKSVNPEVTVFLQPSNPLFNATFYPVQIKDLQDYAAEQKLPYLNHWENWPKLDDEKMNQYLTKQDDQPSVPSEEGHKIWADYLIEYFVAE
ncbi:SGNH/GDSL hydrolase family protein [Metabacillus malikii]|uniref:SGNH/GDSL hydrolase family protein n=1 Tax=Metabacillus malikii TaxID=1504265 RepID=A0ABT9ZGM7_9BACI|nr:SGNH/GDSL hydrolase family protein [Metabacillus malikii]MDQ0231422.1 hypothetical protein [Metabacillus malikii]